MITCLLLYASYFWQLSWSLGLKGSFLYLILKRVNSKLKLCWLLTFPIFLEQVFENMFSSGGQDVKVCVLYLLLGVKDQLAYFLVYTF
jgi:hypothetical protein